MSNLNFKLMKLRLLLLSFLALTLVIGLNAQTDPGTDNLTHSWTFEDGANDAVGGVAGTLVGGAEVVDGQLVIDAAGEWMEMSGLLIGISGYSELSVATWFTSPADEAANPAWGMLWYFGGSEIPEGGDIEFGSNGIFFQPARGDDVIRTAISCGDVATPWVSENGVNRWPEAAFGDSTYHAVTTINDAFISLYINGELIDTANLTGDNSLSNVKDDYAWIGRGGYAGDDNYWGKVGSLEMYDDVLTADEVLWLYQNVPSAIDNTRYQTFDVNIYSSGGTIFMRNNQNADISSVHIFDMSGRLVYQSSVFETEIHANLPSSVYIVQVQSNLGQVTKKIAIE